MTYRLITLTPDVSLRTAYRADFWRRKVVYERRGLVFDDAVVRANGACYHTYYRLINTREYGTVHLIRNGRLSDPQATGATGLGVSIQPPFNQAVLIFPDRIETSWVIEGGGLAKPEVIRQAGVLACDYVSGGWLLTTERGEVRETRQSGEPKLVRIPVPVVEFTRSNEDFLTRDGELYRYIGEGRVTRLSIKHTVPFVLLGGKNTEGCEQDGTIIGSVWTEKRQGGITIQPGRFAAELLLSGNLAESGDHRQPDRQPIPVIRLLADPKCKVTIDGMLRGYPGGPIANVFGVESDKTVIMVIRSGNW